MMEGTISMAPRGFASDFATSDSSQFDLPEFAGPTSTFMLRVRIIGKQDD
jgi:hypothetical protein